MSLTGTCTFAPGFDGRRGRGRRVPRGQAARVRHPAVPRSARQREYCSSCATRFQIQSRELSKEMHCAMCVCVCVCVCVLTARPSSPPPLCQNLPFAKTLPTHHCSVSVLGNAFVSHDEPFITMVFTNKCHEHTLLKKLCLIVSNAVFSPGVVCVQRQCAVCSSSAVDLCR